jgi:NAD(P)-dependent dehydrogenase (short-subunit alcohol dehydrogenase family)
MGSKRPADRSSVLITGTSSGIGEACALELHERGFRVFAGVRREADGRRLIDRTSARLTPILLDVTDADAIARAAETVEQMTNGTGLSGLVNNAGITVAFPLEFLPIEQLRRQFEVNVFGLLAVTQAMLPLLRSQPGRIVNISSIVGHVAPPYTGAYAASKHAIEALSDSLRVELRRFGVKVSLVEPADVDTPIWQKSREAADALRDELMEQRGHLYPQEVHDIYTEDIAAMRAATTRMAAHAIPARRVVRAVVRALCDRRPRARYPVGAKTWAVMLGLKWLPAGIRDWLVRRNLGMK